MWSAFLKNPLLSFFLLFLSIPLSLVAQLVNFLLITRREDKVVSRMCEDMSNKEAIFVRNWHRFFTKGISTFPFHRSSFARAFNEENAKIYVSEPN